ncbi:uncharacterized protein E1O_23780 [Burkholderiales bacterium GJ-E10]|nr:uncharacterized protein E1O_23780 [Burkholderiales bacterium GJ-E10]
MISDRRPDLSIEARAIPVSMVKPLCWKAVGRPREVSERRCRGFVLVTALLLVLILTLLAVGGVSLFGAQVRTAANVASQEIAFQAAEAALQQAQTNLLSGAYPLSLFARNSGGLYETVPTSPPVWTTVSWTSTSAVIPVTALTGLPSGVQGAYLIELMPPVVVRGGTLTTPSNVYRITAEGTQATGGAPVILQSVVIQ